MRLSRHFLVGAIAIACAASLSCKVNDYCLNCANGDGGNDGPDDGKNDGNTDGKTGDGGGQCIPTGSEVCNGKDDNCDGQIDNGPMPEIGDPCPNQKGECAGGVKMCVNGAIVCSKNPKPEKCNLLDDDCDGVIDNGDPSDTVHVSGSICGTNAGECTAGKFHCNTATGVVTCGLNCGTGAAFDCPIGGENPPFGTGLDTSCNAKDDNCNGQFDEDVPPGGLCGGAPDGVHNAAPSICRQGTFQCIAGATLCIGSIEPQPFELCDNIDNDCDGKIDEDFSFKTDPQNCGGCGALDPANICDLPHAFEGCADPDGNGPLPPACTVLGCETGFHNNDGQAANGCEFGPCTITSSVEVCNGIDDDCNPATGNNGPPPGNLVETGLSPPPGFTCLQLGECFGAVPVCTGVNGFRCNYGPTVSQDANGNVIPETLCDGKDNDCDGNTDENQPNLGDPCLESGKQGICQGSGSFQCDPGNLTGPAKCVITTAGGTAKPEECNNLDDDCDGVVDNGAATGNLVGQEWVNIPGLTGVQIMKYEASRRDSTDTSDGTTSTFACSDDGRLPWTNITYLQAKAVCDSMNGGAGQQARLCTEAEWQQMCMPTVTYGANGVTGPATAGATDFVFIEAEDFLANTPNAGRTWNRTAPLSLNGVTMMQATGTTQTSVANALTQSPRLDYRLNLNGATSYNIWHRIRLPAIPTVQIRGSTAPVAGTQANAPASTEVGDMVIVTTWTTTTNNSNTAQTLQAGFTEIRQQSNSDGNDDSRLGVAFRVATVAGAQAYQAYTTGGGTASFTGITVLPSGTFLTSGIGSVPITDDTDNTTADPPTAANISNANSPSTLLVVGGWHYGATATNSAVTPPAGFTEIYQVAGAQVSELSMAVQNTLQTACGGGNPACPNPAAFGNVSNNLNTQAMTISIPRPTTLMIRLVAGTTAAAPSTIIQTMLPINQTTWIVSPALVSGAAGAHTFSIFMGDSGVMIDTIAVARQSVLPPTFDNAWAYETNPRVEQTTTCNSDDFDTDGNAANGDQDANLPTGSRLACFANHANPDDAFDMTGNVKEWTLARALNQNPLRGGAANNEANGTTCQLNFSLADNTFFFPNVGFRCCRGP